MLVHATVSALFLLGLMWPSGRAAAPGRAKFDCPAKTLSPALIRHDDEVCPISNFIVSPVQPNSDHDRCLRKTQQAKRILMDTRLTQDPHPGYCQASMSAELPSNAAAPISRTGLRHFRQHNFFLRLLPSAQILPAFHGRGAPKSQ